MPARKTKRSERPETGDEAAGRIEPGRRPTINDIARLANVSKKTVSRVINESPFVQEETRKRIAELMKTHGYEPDPQARGLAFRRSFLIGMIYDNPNAQMVVKLQEGVLEGVRGSGFELVVHPCDRSARNFLSDVRGFVQRQKLLGVVLLPPVSENDTLTAMLTELGCHYVRVASAVIDDSAHLVSANDRLGTAEAANHLMDLGHTRIGFIEGPPGFRSRKERRLGFEEALSRRGQKLPESLVTDGAYTYESGVAAAETLLSRTPRPTAIFAANDEMAAGVYAVARQKGLTIPRDLSIVGFDDTPVSARLFPALTTVRWPIPEMGRSAARKLLDMRPGERVSAPDEVLTPYLVVRDSTAPPKARSSCVRRPAGA